MSITVKDCLKLPSFHYAKLVAGKGGLDRIVSSVSVVEIPEDESDLRIFNPNELSISAFYAIKDDPAKQIKTMRILSEVGVVCLVLFYVGSIVEELSEEVLQTAEQMNLPLIIMDSVDNAKAKYSDVITDIMNAVFYDQITTKDFVSSTKHRLEQIPESKRDMENLLKVVTSSYKCNLHLYDSSGLYFTAIYRQSYGIFDGDFFPNLFRSDPPGYVCKEIRYHGNSYYVYKLDFSHESNSWLTLYASCSSNRLNEDIMNDMCACTNYFSSLWGYSLDMQDSKTALALILKSSKVIAEKFLQAMAIQQSSISNLMIFDTESDLLLLQEKVAAVFSEYEKFCIADIIDQHLVILTSLNLSNKIDTLLVQDLGKLAYENLQSTSFFLDSDARDIPALRRAYSDYCANASTMDKIFLHRKYRDMHDVIFAQEVIGLSKNRNARKPHIQSIIQLLQEDHDDLMETLAVYLIDCDAQLNLTAATLFLHRNTVSYRLNKIKKISNADFTKMPATYDFYLAAALWRLH